MTSKPLPSLKPRCLCLDIETSRSDRLALREIGAYRPDTDERLHLPAAAPALAARLDAITGGAGFILGHNIIAFDQPTLALLHPQLKLHTLPAIDTLQLSPVAFPQNPYHRLVKDYKLVSDTRNDPVRDAELAFELFDDQRQALEALQAIAPDEVLCLHYLMTESDGRGCADFFARLRRALRPGEKEVAAALRRRITDRVCATALERLISEQLPQSDSHLPIAYTLAWLRVAGGNSVLPPWVRLNFGKTRELIGALRDTPCGAVDCVWCNEHHDIKKELARYFEGFVDFRPEPRTPAGKSLQEAIVQAGYAGRSCLAILPTGGGKSLCYQLPALSRYFRTGSLTVIVSPLQSLMKDQVDSLRLRTNCAAALNGLLTPLERKEVLEKLRLGDLGIILVSPEQFRSSAFTQAIRQREIGAWVFDEAHCLSKWGHDFRPDYLYVARFIRERHSEPLAPVFCFTATAKLEVVEDLKRHFQSNLGLELEVLSGGIERRNLHYEAIGIPTQGKYPETLRLIQEELRSGGGAIVFCARQKATEDLAAFLSEAGVDCRYFHGGLGPDEKRHVQEDFISGALPVIVATNAFGMGVDKPNVRLVIHADIPGSLENYLQEAGRAGRDQEPARCVLLFDENDIDVQFRLLRDSRLTRDDIAAILKALRHIDRQDKSQGTVIASSGEILLEIQEKTRIDPEAHNADTQVRTALAWLEQARLLSREENRTSIFPGSLRVAALEEARSKLQGAGVKKEEEVEALTIVGILMQSAADEGISIDELSLATGTPSETVQKRLLQLEHLGVLANDIELGVILSQWRDESSQTRLANLLRQERKLIALLRELAPDADDGNWYPLHRRSVCHRLREESGVDMAADDLARLLGSFAESFGKEESRRGLLDLRPDGREYWRLKLLRSWQRIEEIAARRSAVAGAAFCYFQALLPEKAQGKELLVTCKLGELQDALIADLALSSLEVKDWQAAIEAALIYLHKNNVLRLARGKAVFRQAMTLRLPPEAGRRQYSKTDHAELELHYADKTLQIHVMAEYAQLALQKMTEAIALVRDYFSSTKRMFIERYFAGRKDILDMATSEASLRQILTDLANPAQQAIVGAFPEENRLILAGPGSGKTRVIVHRVAWLLRVKRIRPEEILVLTYNRAAALEIRRRMWALAGPDAAGTSILTLHGLAMQLTGTSFAVAAERGEDPDFAAVLRKATELLNGRAGDDSDGQRRDSLLAGLRHVLIDEYQDINREHYDLVSAVAGRTANDKDARLHLMAVGDDDQNIYEFNDANVEFIRRFENDYQAKRHFLTENYRSTGHIVDAANAVIARAPERMKAAAPIGVDAARRDQPPGGRFAAIDPLAQGRVHVLEVPSDLNVESQLALAELQRLHALDRQSGWRDFAVLAHKWAHLNAFFAACLRAGIPCRLRNSEAPKLRQTREGRTLLDLLQAKARRAPKRRVLLRSGTLGRWFRRRYPASGGNTERHPWRQALARFIASIEDCAPNTERVVGEIIEELYEFDGQAESGDQLTLSTVHGAKGQEYAHVLILDGGGWKQNRPDVRRLYYVGMTRAKQTLTLCERTGARHAFIPELGRLPLRSRPAPVKHIPELEHGWCFCGQGDIVLSYPSRFHANEPIHRALAQMEVDSQLRLRARTDQPGKWELTDCHGTAVVRFSGKFALPEGEIVDIRVAAILVRDAKPDEAVKVPRWELLLPVFETRPQSKPSEQDRREQSAATLGD